METQIWWQTHSLNQKKQAARRDRLAARLKLSKRYDKKLGQEHEEVGLPAMVAKQEKMNARQGDLEIRIFKLRPTIRSDFAVKLAIYDEQTNWNDENAVYLVRDFPRLLAAAQPAA